jgi:rhodanese-related sulfurtransferase
MPAAEPTSPVCATVTAAARDRVLTWPLACALLAAASLGVAAPVLAQGSGSARCGAVIAAAAAGVECATVAALPPELTPRQVWALKQRHGAQLLLIDVRTPDEARATGVADVTDHVVPVRLPKPATGAAQPVLVDDAQFVDNVATTLRLAGAAPATPIAVICRTGNRSGIAAQRLRAAGFVNVVNVVGGLDGKSNAMEDDEMGWRAARLPMTRAVDSPL